MRPADAASENSRSRRAGTWKECTTRTDTKSTVSGSSTEEMARAGALTAWTNHTETAMAATATSPFTHPGGRVRVAYEKTMPSVTSPMAP